ncbi:unnamed protein product [Rotaria socialis]|uniref:Uncharacterized protein n=1 Tax=Rotaria socialis TaxID=392032 RepID=A0A818KYK1_9BILA|nr:unnamed protein product [Rotaria socialis]CAF3566404.1 unnamed protein product [Rotaria socialis]CAF3611766.1 unnamed protein product [Rotaria socialis]
MNYVDIYDNSKKAIVQLVISPDNVVPSNYFVATFPGATGLIYKNSDSNKFVSIPKDVNGNFRWEWNPNIVYDVIYADPSRNRSLSSSSNKSKYSNWFAVIGSLFRSTNPISYDKKTK